VEFLSTRPVTDGSIPESSPAPHGWCFWRGWVFRRIGGEGARESCGHPNCRARASRLGCSSPPERGVNGIAEGASTSVGQPLHPTLLVAIEDLVAGLAGDAKLPAKIELAYPRHGSQRYWVYYLAFVAANSLIINAIPTSRQRGAVAAPGKYLPCSKVNSRWPAPLPTPPASARKRTTR
jgi:hypothetical protein